MFILFNKAKNATEVRRERAQWGLWEIKSLLVWDKDTSKDFSHLNHGLIVYGNCTKLPSDKLMLKNVTDRAAKWACNCIYNWYLAV